MLTPLLAPGSVLHTRLMDANPTVSIPGWLCGNGKADPQTWQPSKRQGVVLPIAAIWQMGQGKP